jgi:ribonuclease G
MSTELIINASLPETRIALMENGEIQELLIERASGKGIVGNIYKGRVTRVLPGMQAAFVDIGLEKAAFLYVDDVHIHSEIWEEEEGTATHTASQEHREETAETQAQAQVAAEQAGGTGEAAAAAASAAAEEPAENQDQDDEEEPEALEGPADDADFDDDEGDEDDDDDLEDDDDEDEEDDDRGPVGMGPGGEGGGDDTGSREQPSGTIAPPSGGGESAGGGGEGPDAGPGGAQAGPGGDQQGGDGRRRHRRGRRGGRNRRRGRGEGRFEGAATQGAGGVPTESTPENMPESYREQLADGRLVGTERPSVEGENTTVVDASAPAQPAPGGQKGRPEFREQRDRGRRIRSKSSMKPPRGQVNIQDLLHEGQEVLVQIAKDPIGTKGARLTCHISLPGRHLVCMPTIDHVGVSRRIDRDDERRKLREIVERNRPKNLGFIVRTASGKGQAERRIKQDIDYLTRLWTEIREKAASVTAPALVYEDLNSVLRAIRDWVTEEIDKIVVDSRYHHNDILRFVSHFMPSLQEKVELYNGDVPIFDAYSITTELSRALERKVWLKSGGYLVIDQAEALVAIDVNTGRYVGKKNLEDTILKTNLEAVQEIAYQLRLRNCGGIIILDLIDMENEGNKKRVYQALEEALRKDRARPNILKISELGLVEMTRKRTRDTMVRSLCEPCNHCEGKGFIKSKQTIGYEIMREIEREGIEREVSKILIQAHADVIDVLAIDERESLDQLERRYRKQIYLQAVSDYHPEQYEVIGEKRDGGERSERKSRDAREEESRDRDRDRGGRGGRRGRRGGRDRDRGGRWDQGRDRGPQQGPIQAHTHAEQAAAHENDGGLSGEAPQAGGPAGDDDRLAFQRAQAAQDAAIATGAAPQGQGQGQGRGFHGGGGQGQGQGPGGGGRRRRRRGGRGRRGGRDRERGGSGGYPHPGGEGPGPAPIQTRSDAPSGGGGEGGGGNGGGDGGGGGGDRSNPPV